MNGLWAMHVRSRGRVWWGVPRNQPRRFLLVFHLPESRERDERDLVVKLLANSSRELVAINPCYANVDDRHIGTRGDDALQSGLSVRSSKRKGYYTSAAFLRRRFSAACSFKRGNT